MLSKHVLFDIKKCNGLFSCCFSSPHQNSHHSPKKTDHGVNWKGEEKKNENLLLKHCLLSSNNTVNLLNKGKNYANYPVSIIRMGDGMWEQSDCLLHQNMKLSSELTDASYFRTDTALSEVPV